MTDTNKSKLLHFQIDEFVNERNFDEAIDWASTKAEHSNSPVFRITNMRSDILKAIQIVHKVEKYHKLFPDNELLNDLANTSEEM